MYLLNNVFTNEHGEAITVLQLLTKFKMVLSEIDEYLNEYGNRLNSIEFKNVTQQQDIDILKNQVQTLQTNVSNLQLTVGDYLLRFTDLDMQLTVINGKITNNTNDISSLNVSVSDIQTSITNINDQISTINNKIMGINTRIDIALSSISNLNEDVSTINTTLSTHTTTIDNLSISLTDLTTLVNNLQNTCTTLTTDLNELTSSVSDLETNDIWQNGQISSLTTFTQLNRNNISALNTLVGNLDERIDVLENNSVTIGGSLELVATDLFETDNSPTHLEPSTVYNLWEYPSNVDTNKTLVNIQTSFAMAGDSTQITITTPNGNFSILPISAGVVSPVTLNIDFIYKISDNVMYWYGVYTLLINGKHPVIRFFSSTTNYAHVDEKTFPLANTHLGISFSAAKLYLQPYVKITKYKIGG